MALNKDNIDFLFDVMKFYDEQYNKITDNCFNEINRALNEIVNDYLKAQNVKILPFGSFAIKNNYQAIEPMEFYCIVKADRSILDKEKLQKERIKRSKKRIKDIYADILGQSNSSTNNNLTAIDVAGIIMRELQKYIDATDKSYFKNNVVFIKFHIDDEVDIAINIYICYDFEQNGLLEFSKLGYKIKENSKLLLENILQKNLNTDGNYLLLSKLVKMLELELILANRSNVYLSNKTLFVENVLYNVPDKFFKGEDFCEMFKNVVNYLKQCDADKIVMPDGIGTPMFSNYGYYANSFFKSFIKKIIYIYKNGDLLLDDAIRSQQNTENTEQNDNLKNNQNNDYTTSEDGKKVNKINKNAK